jgi:hypothetical protein
MHARKQFQIVSNSQFSPYTFPTLNKCGARTIFGRLDGAVRTNSVGHLCYNDQNAERTIAVEI